MDHNANIDTNMEDVAILIEEEEEETPAQLKERVCSMTYAELCVRKDFIIARFDTSAGDNLPTATTSAAIAASLPPVRMPANSKGDTHWDYLMKELMWLAADFASERKRQISQAKRLSLSVRQFHNTKHLRLQKEIAEIELRKRRLASKIAREVKQFWNKIERVIAYKQKVTSEQERHKAMDRHLLSLVQRTEEYGQSLHHPNINPSNREHRMTVEEALHEFSSPNNTTNHSSRMAKKLKTDYTQVLISNDDKELYGQSIVSDDSSSNESYQPSDDDDSSTSSNSSFQEAVSELNPKQLSEEIQILLEESNANLQDVLDSYYKASNTDDLECDDGSSSTVQRRNAAVVRRRIRTPTEDIAVQREETSDDGNLSKKDLSNLNDVEDKVTVVAEELQDEEEEEQSSSSADDGSEEFVVDSEEMDDETTLIAEEGLGKNDFSTEEEIAMLQREQDVPIEELLALYERMNSEQLPESENDEEDDGSEEFYADPEEMDDETTLIAEEKLGKNELSAEEEIAMLQREQDVPIEELLSLHARMTEESENLEIENNMESSSLDDESQNKEYHNLLLSETNDPPQTKKRKKEDMESSFKGGSLVKALEVSETRARETHVTRPFLLSSWVKLRPYQQIGLNWLVSLQSRRLNGILADEMGLGKTLQTISLLAYLAAYHGIWGPHLIIVPTSVILNWETEIKRFCPSFKVLCYYGSAKRRKELRQGWTRTNWHHIVVTSYQLAVQDSFAFKRKRWYYLILDEAHNIKNFQSQRWQTLINFNSQRRLLLTGTPLQNNLMELWSLLHFLMPHIFRDRKEFSYWFSNPMNQIIEGNVSRNDDLISRLHGIIRPFVLRRLKNDVEKQMPGKHEHIVKCQLSRRQMFLYEEFLGRSSTRMAVKKGGNFLGMMNVLMQLRKVCNHPDLFEPRSILTPFFTEPLSFRVPGLVINALEPPILETVSASLIHQLWAKGCGVPAFESALRHDVVVASQLQSLESPREVIIESLTFQQISDEEKINDKYSPGLRALLTSIRATEKEEALENAKLIAKVNSLRCQCEAFPYDNRTINVVSTGNIFFSFSRYGKDNLSAKAISETPTQLLEMLRTEQERSEELASLIERFVFCVPRAGARCPILETNCNTLSEECSGENLFELDKSFKRYFSPFTKAAARLTSFFPEQKLVQYDAGKLVILAELLRELKKGGHRVLIFTQMSKMLDILESFVNLHGLSYLRLDGSVAVDERQRLMDRFNNDPKIFCFILSTRSGGLGINLTGADTVVFYDSDWCPSIDAQAQDRAHRIGQTREVHIYRLVTEHTIEENILLRAKQKRQLDFLVMDEGKFHATSSYPQTENNDNKRAQDLFTKEGLRNILGVLEDGAEEESVSGEEESQQEVSKEQLDETMAALEDEDDANAKLGAEKEAARDLQEFDESIQFTKETEEDGGGESQESQMGETDHIDDGAFIRSKKSNTPLKRKASNNEEDDSQEVDSTTDALDPEEEEKEFEEWQTKVGFNISSIAESLTPAERYALHFKEDVDPYYSFRYLADWRKLQEEEATEKHWDVEEIEEAKAEEEWRAIEDGDLLVTKPIPKDLPRQRLLYLREKARLKASKKRRILTGENWCVRIDALTKHPFWYNTDTGEAIWDKPLVLIELEAEELARSKLWNALPIKSLVHIMKYLIPYPDRQQCSLVCRQWRAAAGDFSFVKHVWPVECGALTMDKAKLEQNHFVSIEDALLASLPGDTIELGDGHYWVKGPGLTVDFPVRFIGDENEPSHVVIELSGSIHWSGAGGWIEGITIRRPKLSNDKNTNQEIIRVEDQGRLDVHHCVLRNVGNVCSLNGNGLKGRWNHVTLKGLHGQGSGLSLQNGASLVISNSTIKGNGKYGVVLKDCSSIHLTNCILISNGLGPLCSFDSGSFIDKASKNNVCDDINSLPLYSFKLLQDSVDKEEMNPIISAEPKFEVLDTFPSSEIILGC